MHNNHYYYHFYFWQCNITITIIMRNNEFKICFIKHYREGVTVRPVHLRRRGRQPERRGRSVVPSHIHTKSVHSFCLIPSNNTSIHKHQNDAAVLRLAYLSKFQSSEVALIAANTANMRNPPTCLQSPNASNY